MKEQLGLNKEDAFRKVNGQWMPVYVTMVDKHARKVKCDVLNEIMHLEIVYKQNGSVITGFNRALSDDEIDFIKFNGFNHEFKVLPDKLISVISKYKSTP
jgi:hypothetical protein